MVKIYLDMDGVLADFDKGVRDFCHILPTSQNQGRGAGYDDLMWAEIRKIDHFYARLELMPGAKELFGRIWEKYGKEQCEILTGIPKPKRGILTAGKDKEDWTRRMLSEDIRVNIVFREQKPEYCHGKDSYLIDDRESNIREWEAIGGTGILHRSAEETLRELERRNLL